MRCKVAAYPIAWVFLSFTLVFPGILGASPVLAKTEQAQPPVVREKLASPGGIKT
jgi:hypothetical protein